MNTAVKVIEEQMFKVIEQYKKTRNKVEAEKIYSEYMSLFDAREKLMHQ